MRAYEIRTVVELTEEQDERLGELCKKLENVNGWDKKQTLEFLTMIRCPEFWDIQLNLLQRMIEQHESKESSKP